MSSPPVGFLAALSRQALSWVSRTPTASPAVLRRRLYDFNRLPLTPGWARRLPDVEAVELFLGLDRPPPAGWRRRPGLDGTGWQQFERLAPRGQAPLQAPGAPVKLYLSPRPEQLPTMIETLWPLLARLPVTAVKVADSLPGLLRPDKLVVYSPRLEWIEDLARQLLEEPNLPAAQGVPFSAEIGGGGLASWGVDQHTAAGLRSWRGWLIERLVDALRRSHFGARRRGPPWRQALEFLRDDGIDVDRWQPHPRLWRRSD